MLCKYPRYMTPPYLTPKPRKDFDFHALCGTPYMTPPPCMPPGPWRGGSYKGYFWCSFLGGAEPETLAGIRCFFVGNGPFQTKSFLESEKSHQPCDRYYHPSARWGWNSISTFTSREMDRGCQFKTVLTTPLISIPHLCGTPTYKQFFEIFYSTPICKLLPFIRNPFSQAQGKMNGAEDARHCVFGYWSPQNTFFFALHNNKHLFC